MNDRVVLEKLERYYTIFPDDMKSYNFICERSNRQVGKDYFREMEKLLKKEKDCLLDDIFVKPCNPALDLDFADMDTLRKDYHHVPVGLACHPFRASCRENFDDITENISHICVLVKLGERSKKSLVDFLTDLVSYGHICFYNSDEMHNILIFSYMYLIIESYFNDRITRYQGESRSVHFELVNEYIIKYRSNKFSTYWRQKIDSPRAIMFSTKLSRHEIYCKVQLCRDRVVKANKLISNPIYLTEFMMLILCDDGCLSLFLKTYVSSDVGFVLCNVSSSSFTCRAKFKCSRVGSIFYTMKAILLYSTSFLSLKKFVVRYINPAADGKQAEATEITNYFKLDNLLRDCDWDVNLYIIPFCTDFSSVEHCRLFFQERRGMYKPLDVEGLHVRDKCTIDMDFEFDHEISDEICIHMINVENHFD